MDRLGKEVIEFKVSKLKPHPRQPAHFAPPSEQQIDELAADIRKNGLLNPIEILPDGTIICGHSRHLAVRKLGWKVVDVWVRHDLAEEPRAAEERMLLDNLVRRQLGPMGLARCYKALRSLNPQRKYPERDRVEVRDKIGKVLRLSGRHLDRLYRILQGTPIEVQNAIETGQLPCSLAEQVVTMSAERKDDIASQIAAGKNAKKVVQAFAPKSPLDTDGTTTPLRHSQGV